MPNKRYDAVMFDMDNTLLKSRIDFKAIKRDMFALLTEAGVCGENLPLEQYTIATLLESAKQTALFTDELERRAWEIVVAGERDGMEGALLEDGAADMLQALQGHFTFAVLTNNALAAAEEALMRTDIARHFAYVAGREQAVSLKPSPAGVRHVMARFPDIPAGRWLYVGDSWIDGRAAADGGIDFLGYRTPAVDLESRGLRPIGLLRAMNELPKYLFE